ncbi:hypothetical protein [Lysinibacillus xylanilyticus]|nr:hypothetical protein [Lysinibacillus xylanilyticus]
MISTSMSKSLTKELEKELLLKHILYEKEAVAVARRKDNDDDVIFWIKKLNKYDVVHLIYSKETSSDFTITLLFTLSKLEEYCKTVSKFH